MFVIRRKHLALILCFLILSFSFYFTSSNTQEKNYELTQVSALPVDTKVIVIDAGHGRRRSVVLLVLLELLRQI